MNGNIEELQEAWADYCTKRRSPTCGSDRAREEFAEIIQSETERRRAVARREPVRIRGRKVVRTEIIQNEGQSSPTPFTSFTPETLAVFLYENGWSRAETADTRDAQAFLSPDHMVLVRVVPDKTLIDYRERLREAVSKVANYYHFDILDVPIALLQRLAGTRSACANPLSHK